MRLLPTKKNHPRFARSRGMLLLFDLWAMFTFSSFPLQRLYRFCTADPANWHFWQFSALEEPITYVESMVCKVRLPSPPPISRLLSIIYGHILISYNNVPQRRFSRRISHGFPSRSRGKLASCNGCCKRRRFTKQQTRPWHLLFATLAS